RAPSTIPSSTCPDAPARSSAHRFTSRVVRPPQALATLAPMDAPAARTDRTEPVTDRQREVARLIAEDKSNREIADALGISLDGAKYHVSELLGRLGLARREDVGAWYREHYGWRPRL